MTTMLPAAGPAVFDDKGRLKQIMEQMTVTELLSVKFDPIPPAQQQRHQRCLLLLMSLVRSKWNGNRRGATGDYPYRSKQKSGLVYGGGKEYLGHNIAAIAVDGAGRVIDFDFNHNDVFRSSLEHAEARLMRRLFSLTGLRSGWSLGDGSTTGPSNERYATTLKEVTVYTSLEPCAQCVGIMSLARIKDIVYLQQDDGAMRVANVLYNLAPYGSRQLPLPATLCGLRHGDALAAAYEEYRLKVTDLTQPAFYISGNEAEAHDRSQSLTSFLCTDVAMDLFEAGAKEFEALVSGPAGESSYPSDPGTPSLLELREFLNYAMKGGHRGTPH